MDTGEILVSCIMPTRGRRMFVPQAIRYFQRQDHARKELVIVDDGDDPIADLVPPDAALTYERMPGVQTVGRKRNVACELARGSVIVHWDDDDWAPPERLTKQVRALVGSGSDVTGASHVLFLDPRRRIFWRYEHPADAKPWVHGATLCYLRDFWKRHPFPNRVFGEDDAMVADARKARFHPCRDDSFYVGLMHPGNTTRKRPWSRRWKRLPVARVSDVMGRDAAFYERPPLGSATRARDAWRVHPQLRKLS